MLDGEVPNAYLKAIRRERDRSVAYESKLAGVLDLVVPSVSDAWVGGCSGGVVSQLSSLKFRASGVADKVVAAFDSAIRSQPVHVPEGSWRALWRGR